MRLERLYRQYEARLRRRITARFAHEPELVEDACQHAWMMAWRNPRPVNFAWLFVVACHYGFDQLDPQTTPVSEIWEGSYEIDDELAARELLRTVASLHPMQRDALADRMAGLTYRESAERRGRTETWVNRHRCEGRAAVRTRLAA